MTFRSGLKIWMELSKVRVTIAVTLTMITGYLMAKGRFDLGMIIPTTAIFLLACGSAGINECQEYKRDAAMPRTMSRPIPSGAITVAQAWFISLSMVAIGFFGLWCSASPKAAMLGLLALAWYNGIYTYLKRVTAFAVVPGSFIGAIPPMIGYVTAGGELFDPRILVVAAFFFIWQIPHFWLLLLRYGQQYEEAGFPSLTQRFSESQLRRLTFIWMMGTAMTPLTIPMIGYIHFGLSMWMLAFTTLWMTLAALLVLIRGSQQSFRRAFIHINMYSLMIMIILSSDSTFQLGSNIAVLNK